MAYTVQSFLAELRQLIGVRFSAEELKLLCFELAVPYEDLPGEGHQVKVMELVGLMNRSQRLPELVELANSLRPRENWPELPVELTAPDLPQPFLTALRKMLVRHFSSQELQTLCFDLGLDYDDLPGEGRVGKAREMVLWAAWHGRLPQLLQLAAQERTAVDWPAIPTDFVPPPRPKGLLFWLGATTAVITLLLGAVGIWYLLSPPPMAAGFNVAVAQFTADNSGLSHDIYQQLSSYNKLFADRPISHLRRPLLIGTVPGADAGSRYTNAARIAAEHNATILIYGVVTPDETQAEVSLELYVNNEALPVQADLSYLTGLRFPDIPVPEDDDGLFNGRVQALQYIVSGFSNLYFDRPESAWEAFKSATQVADWPEDKSKADLYLLMAAVTPMPENSFNVAVAQFTVIDETGQAATSELSHELSDLLFKAIEKRRNALAVSEQFQLRGPDEIGPVWGHDLAERSDRAVIISGSHRANLLIYGVVTFAGNQPQVSLEFTVSDNESFSFGSEVIGPDQLGSAVSFRLPLTVDNTDEALSGRIEALKYVVSGLAYYYDGRYEAAYTDFYLAVDQLEREEGKNGREVVYLVMGAAMLQAYNSEKLPHQLELARSSFGQAQREDYGRSYLGLGALALADAKNSSSLTETAAFLAEAEQAFLIAWGMPDQPELAYIPTKAANGLGEVYLLARQKEITSWAGQATAIALGCEAEAASEYAVAVSQCAFDTALKQYEALGRPLALTWSIGHIQAKAGILAGYRNDWGGMVSQTREAIRLLDSLPGSASQDWIAHYWARIGLVYKSQNQANDARIAYQEAIRLGKGYVSDEDIKEWESMLAQLEENS